MLVVVLREGHFCIPSVSPMGSIDALQPFIWTPIEWCVHASPWCSTQCVSLSKIIVIQRLSFPGISSEMFTNFAFLLERAICSSTRMKVVLRIMVTQQNQMRPYFNFCLTIFCQCSLGKSSSNERNVREFIAVFCRPLLLTLSVHKKEAHFFVWCKNSLDLIAPL